MESALPSTDHRLRDALLWCTVASFVAGLISWLSADVYALSREQFLLPYSIAAVTLVLLFVRREGIDVLASVRAHPLRTAVVTAIASALMISTVMLQPGASRAHGSRLAFELVWDGMVYGAVDGVLLTVLPIVAMRRALDRQGLRANALALLPSLGVFVVYHLGFPEFRGEAIGAPIVAGLVFGTAQLLARNPLSPIVAHAAMHVAAVLHGPAGTVQLPPHY